MNPDSREQPRDNTGTVTALLRATARGEPDAQSKLFNVVYDRLHRIAKKRMSVERPGHTFQASDLVNELYIRFSESDKESWAKNRGHFYQAAAECMRRILVERARKYKWEKRRGEHRKVPLGDGDAVTEAPDEQVLAIHGALAKLEETHPRQAQVVKFRYFLQLTVEETATQLGVSPRTVDYDWNYAKAWLHGEISNE